MPDLTFLSAVSMAEQIRQKELSPVELVEAHLTRIEELNPTLNAFVQVDAEGARRQARVRRKRPFATGKTLGVLHGVPLSIKSSIEVAGLPWEAGTKLRAGIVGERDAPLVARLRQAGAIILGVTNAPELLMAWETDNLLYGRTNNPWDLTRTPGGSSGGEAAAIAAGMSAGGVGSDGGGSIRVPAHFSGICGLKPTPGRIPATGHFPESVGPFALLGVVGPLARNMDDLKVLFEVMQGPDDGDPSAAPVPLRWPEDDDLKRVRIGYFEDDGRTPVTPETRAAVRTAAEALRRAGFQVEPFRPEGLEQARQLWWKLFGIAGGMVLGPMIKGREAELSPILQEFSRGVAGQPSHTGESLLDTWIERDAVAHKDFCPDAGLSGAALSGGFDSRVSPRRAQLAGGGKDREVSGRLELHRMVQSAGHSRCRSAGREVAGRPAHRRADCGAPVGGGTGDFGSGGSGTGARSLSASEYLSEAT